MKERASSTKEELMMQVLSFDVSGMTCGGCTGSVQRALGKLEGVGHAEVSLRPGIATVVAGPARDLFPQRLS